MFDIVRQHYLITLVVALIATLLLWGMWPQAVLVDDAAVKRAPLTISVEEEGRTRVIDRYVIAAPVDGVTCRQDLNVGDLVNQGQVLLNITPMQPQVLDQRSRSQAQSSLAAARATLLAVEEQAALASANAQLATSELERLRPLVKQNLVSREAFERAENVVHTSLAAKRSAEFRIDVARYELEAARTMVEYSTNTSTSQDITIERIAVHSPINGRILKVARECEGPVRTGEVLLEVGDPSALEIEVDVLSADAVKIKPTMKVLIRRWGGEGTLEAVVRTVEPSGFTKTSALGVEEQRVLIIADFTSPATQWQRLGDGYRIEAEFILSHDDNLLQVPASSLFRYQQGWAVFVIDGNHARRQVVEVGLRNGLVAQIISGVNEGDHVVNHPSDAVEDDVRVRLATNLDY